MTVSQTLPVSRRHSLSSLSFGAWRGMVPVGKLCTSGNFQRIKIRGMNALMGGHAVLGACLVFGSDAYRYVVRVKRTYFLRRV